VAFNLGLVCGHGMSQIRRGGLSPPPARYGVANTPNWGDNSVRIQNEVFRPM